ncbi:MULTISPECIES: SDR family NAD(P)-dependent oxidoreductase [Dietzia]|uniref:SDR family NAD(P)-dependent oxidoreductase n=1 Tax=Dietzia TaxID=37914 RepID=UPI0022B5D642|nr:MULTISPECIES: SDR family oxidoreductase [Dietzia]MCZ4538582.1 SDR family oxidoreductase [Dietzia maris]MDV3355074.1 SDR family oxidoreductase [Dietzia sp. IN118]
MATPAELFDLSGRVAVVTGASSGLGDGFARTLAAAGATVVAAARRADRLEALAADLPGVVPVECDITVPADRERLVGVAAEINGGVDILVNNAGRPGPPDALTESAEEFDDILRVNLTSGFHLSVAAVKARPEDREMSIINVSSVIGLVSTAPIGGAGYAASKSAVIGTTRELAGQWGRQGIRVNAVVPGWFDTEMTDGLFTNDKSAGWVRRNSMLGRGGREGEVDGAVLFLASDASSYVTGHVLTVDGGWTAR